MANVSVIIPCYNSEKTIRETIESVLAQTYKDYEIVVVDDGSTDQSKAIVQSFGSEVKYFYQVNGGQSAARNTAIRNSTGKFLAFLDADDLWHPQKLEKQLAKMDESGVDWCFCECECFEDESGKTIGKFSQLVRPPQTGWVAPALLMGNFISSPTPIVTREAFEKAGYFDESPEIRSREDWDEWVRIAIFSKIEFIPDILAKYRIHWASVTHTEDSENAYNSHIAVVNKLCELYPEQLGTLKQEAKSNYAMIYSKVFYFNKDYSAARKLIRTADKGNPKVFYKLLLMIYSLPAFVNNFILKIRSYIVGEI